METITGKFHQNPLKNVGGTAETRLTAEKSLKGHNSDKNQLSMTPIKCDHLQVTFIVIPIKYSESKLGKFCSEATFCGI